MEECSTSWTVSWRQSRLRRVGGRAFRSWAIARGLEDHGLFGFLMVEAVLMSQKEESFDEKTPHLRFKDAINCEGGRLFRLLGDTENHEMVSNNPVQGLLLIDQEHNVNGPFSSRGRRTAVRAPPPKGQEECLNYFGTLAPKVKAVLVHCHTHVWKLNMSNAVMHREVTPGRPAHVVASRNLLRARRLRLGPRERHERSW